MKAVNEGTTPLTEYEQQSLAREYNYLLSVITSVRGDQSARAKRIRHHAFSTAYGIHRLLGIQSRFKLAIQFYHLSYGNITRANRLHAENLPQEINP